MARRRTDVLRNLDDPVRLAGVLSVQSAGLLLALTMLLVLFDLLFGWTKLLGPAGFLVLLGVVGLAASALAFIERHDDQHLVPAALRYYLQRLGSGVFSPAVIDGFPPRNLEHVFADRDKDRL